MSWIERDLKVSPQGRQKQGKVLGWDWRASLILLAHFTDDKKNIALHLSFFLPAQFTFCHFVEWLLVFGDKREEELSSAYFNVVPIVALSSLPAP